MKAQIRITYRDKDKLDIAQKLVNYINILRPQVNGKS